MCSRVIGVLNEIIIEIEATAAVASFNNLEASEVGVTLNKLFEPGVLVRLLTTNASAGNNHHSQEQRHKTFAVKKEKITCTDQQEEKRGAIHSDRVGHQGNHDVANSQS